MEEMQTLLSKDAIKEMPQSMMGQGFYSKYFVISKRDGGRMPIMDLQGLNKHESYSEFWMVTLQTILPLLLWDAWLAWLNLQDVYYHLKIRSQHHHFMRFTIGSLHYQYWALSFGLSMAPQVVTNCMVTMAAALWQ